MGLIFKFAVTSVFPFATSDTKSRIQHSPHRWRSPHCDSAENSKWHEMFCSSERLSNESSLLSKRWFRSPQLKNKYYWSFISGAFVVTNAMTYKRTHEWMMINFRKLESNSKMSFSITIHQAFVEEDTIIRVRFCSQLVPSQGTMKRRSFEGCRNGRTSRTRI